MKSKKGLKTFLSGLRGGIFKILPMKEDEIKGTDNHLVDYIESLLINMQGAMEIYPELDTQEYIEIVNKIKFLSAHEISFETWRKTILSATHTVCDLYVSFGGEYDKQ